MVLHVAQNTPENTCNPCALAVIGLDHSLSSAEILQIPLFSAGQTAFPFGRPLDKHGCADTFQGGDGSPGEGDFSHGKFFVQDFI